MGIYTGTANSETLVGSEGADSFASSAGTDILSGLAGDDRFLITGGGTIYVDDTVGTDTLDASGATTAVTVDLTPGGSATSIGGATVNLSHPATGSMVDVFLLEDLSGSFGDDLASVQRLVPSMVSTIGATGADVAYGVGSFIDKPVNPFGSTYGDYVYRTELAVTRSESDLQSTVNALRIGSGYDTPEAQIEALFQVARRAATGTEIGFREGALRTVVLSTDAVWHVAGDGGASGLGTANNGDAVVDANEDYPTVAQLRDALTAAGIVPIFAVTSDVADSYRSLVSDLGVGVVVPLSEDSSNLVTALTSGITAARNSLIENAIGGGGDDTLTGNAVNNSLIGNAGNDTLKGGVSVEGGNGDDYLNGGAGTDTAVFIGNQSDYIVTRVDGTTYTVQDTVAGRDGLDTVVDVETLRFAGGTLTLTPASPPPVVTPRDNAGESVSTAYSFGTLIGTAANRSTAEYVGNADPIDYYKFVLSTRSTINVVLSDMSGDANISLRNPLDGVITRSATRGTDNETLNRTLSAGTYFLRVDDAGTDTPYQLALSATPVDIDPVEPLNMGVLLSSPRRFSDTVTYNADPALADTDTFRFTVLANSRVNFNLRGDRGDVDMTLVNAATNAVVTRTTTDGTVPDAINSNLAAGTYLLKVVAANGVSTDYSLSMSATVRDGAGNSQAGATNLGSLRTTPLRASDAVGDGDPADWYRFNVASAGTVNVVLSGMTGDADVALLDSTGAELQMSATSGATTETLTETVSRAGVYYLRVSDRGLDTAYSLQLSAVARDQVGDTLATAANRGILASGSTVRGRTGEIVVGSDIDLYRFVIAAAGSTIRFQLSGMTADADLALLDATGDVIQESSTDGRAGEEFTRELAVGTYYARVACNGGDQTPYTLSISSTALDNVGDDAATAYNMGTLVPRAATSSDSIARGDLDYYQFVVGSNASVTMALTGITARTNVDFVLENADGSVRARSNATSDTLTESLSPGTYNLKVLPVIGETPYNVSLSAIPRDSGANTQAAAEESDLGTLDSSSSVTQRDFIGTGSATARDEADWWLVRVDADSTTLTASLSEMTAGSNVTLKLWDTDRTLRTQSITSTGGSVSQRVGMGIYYVQVLAGGSDSNYLLTVATGSAASSTPAARRIPSFAQAGLNLDRPLSGSARAASLTEERMPTWSASLASAA